MSGIKQMSKEELKKLSPLYLLRILQKMKDHLKQDETMLSIFKEYETNINELEYIPMTFADIDVSAKWDHGILYFNYELLKDDFESNYSYAIHELTHFLQQTCSTKPTKSSDDGNYLDNKYEQEGFQNQVEYIAKDEGEDEAKDYVDDLLDHHEIDSKKEIKEKKNILLENLNN